GRGKALGALSPETTHGVQVAGIRRGGERILTPGAQETLQADDEILVLGTAEQIREFRGWLIENPETEA
ncbi:MAG TPA: TrkA C-terminal domain-containing protein, partial [Opitutaceae bacterium]